LLENVHRRIRRREEGAGRLQYRDYADHSRSKEITLSATELLRRFLLHFVPRGFMRIRHYGITANRHREQKLARARELLGKPSQLAAEEKPSLDGLETNTTDTVPDPSTCPACGGRMRVVEVILPARRGGLLFLPASHDTS
jgi:Putative transposase